MSKRKAHTGRAPLSTVRDLYETLHVRRRPEDVAAMVVEVLGGELRASERRILDKAARHSSRGVVATYTSMLEDFARPKGMEKQVRVAQALFENASKMSVPDCADPKRIEELLERLSAEIHKNVAQSDFRADRLNREARAERGMEISKRRYNKLWRLLTRMERKLTVLVRELKKREFTQIGKSALATKIPFEEFETDRSAACFIAYYTARRNMRSQFSVTGQERAFDEIAEMLLERCERQTTNWWAIAHVYPERFTLARLTEEQRGELLAAWYEILVDIAELLKDVWEASSFRRDTMIVKRGDDSTTWNNTASAWNCARSAWISLLSAMGLESLLDVLCPGKVLRLMAADVVAWHQYTRGPNNLSPDTAVWADAPLPWEVLSGKVPCTRETLLALCKKHGLNPKTSGWTMPRPKKKAARYRPTPELVHGVVVGSPALATRLRKAGWFSGKAAQALDSVEVERDEYGFALRAH